MLLHVQAGYRILHNLLPRALSTFLLDVLMSPAPRTAVPGISGGSAGSNNTSRLAKGMSPALALGSEASVAMCKDYQFLTQAS